jgi:hypothetical protein
MAGGAGAGHSTSIEAILGGIQVGFRRRCRRLTGKAVANAARAPEPRTLVFGEKTQFEVFEPPGAARFATEPPPLARRNA